MTSKYCNQRIDEEYTNMTCQPSLNYQSCIHRTSQPTPHSFVAFPTINSCNFSLSLTRRLLPVATLRRVVLLFLMLICVPALTLSLTVPPDAAIINSNNNHPAPSPAPAPATASTPTIGTEVDDFDAAFDMGLGVEMSEHTAPITTKPSPSMVQPKIEHQPPVEEPSLTHPLHDEVDDTESQYDVHGVEHDSDILVREGPGSPQSPEYKHPVNEPDTFPDSYQIKKLHDHLVKHHPNDPLIKHIEEYGHTEHPALIDRLKSTTSHWFDRGGKIIRKRDYSSLEVTVVTLAILVTIALCCVAISLHCHCSQSLMSCMGRISKVICPCCTRFFITQPKLRPSDELQLKKTLYYEHSRLADDDHL